MPAAGAITTSMARVAIAALLATACAALAPPRSAAATPPGNFERHEGAHWTWYAPPRWTASEGANDIYVGSATGTLFLHYGAGGTPCYQPQEFFEYVRAAYLRARRHSFDLYSFPLASAHYTKVGAIQTVGPSYYRQTVKYRGRRPNGAVILGELVLDEFAVEPAGGVCGERQQVRAAPARGIGASLRLLRIVQGVIFGPR
ncbi:MAG: hypothetical protein ACM3NV_02820 [Syntrophothermus sp.]